MGKFFDRNNIRFKQDDFILYNLTMDDINNISAMINDKIEFDKDLNATAKDIGLVEIYKYLIKNCSNYEFEELSDEDIIYIIESTEYKFLRLGFEIKHIINEIIEIQQQKQYEYLDFIDKTINILNMAEDQEKIKTKFEKLFKRKGLNMTYEEFTKISENPEEMQKEIINKLNNVKKKNKK